MTQYTENEQLFQVFMANLREFAYQHKLAAAKMISLCLQVICEDAEVNGRGKYTTAINYLTRRREGKTR